MILTRAVLFIVFIVLYSNFSLAQEKNSLELTINRSAKVHSLLVPKGILPLNSQLNVYINNSLVSAKVSYNLLWPKSRDLTESIRVLNIVLVEARLIG